MMQKIVTVQVASRKLVRGLLIADIMMWGGKKGFSASVYIE